MILYRPILQCLGYRFSSDFIKIPRTRLPPPASRQQQQLPSSQIVDLLAVHLRRTDPALPPLANCRGKVDTKLPDNRSHAAVAVAKLPDKRRNIAAPGPAR